MLQTLMRRVGIQAGRNVAMKDREIDRYTRLEREAREWRLRAEVLALSQAPSTADAYLRRACELAARVLGAAQVVFWAHDPDTEVLEARHAATFEPVADVPRVVFLEALAARAPRTAAIPDAHGALRTYVLGPVYVDDRLAGVFQVVPAEPVLDPGAEAAVAVLAEAVAAGLGTVAAFEQLSFQASHDPLTRLANRRSFQAFLDRELRLAERHGTPVSLLVIDADHFKRYNDTYGHPAGDALLQALAERLGEVVRSTDFVARYGGEEFAIVLPHTDAEGAMRAANKVLEGVRSLHADHGDLPGDHTTVSVGVATLGGAVRTAEALFKAADQALYRAKHGGRDRAVAA